MFSQNTKCKPLQPGSVPYLVLCHNISIYCPVPNVREALVSVCVYMKTKTSWMN